ncbi:DUF3618 domain-containing protein [Sphingomonas sp. DT-207]|uniref:DUF3618 domain-containing protein n=1 Tax=Sphingomonas sp. DT-207 TaxID=3396167 RepID=UPI003F1E23F9
MTAPSRLPRAEAEVQAARARLFGTLGEVRQRLRPSNFAQDAVETAAQGIASAARARPWAVAALAGTIGLVMARGWIVDAVRRRRNDDATPAPTAGLDSKRGKPARRAKKGP